MEVGPQREEAAAGMSPKTCNEGNTFSFFLSLTFPFLGQLEALAGPKSEASWNGLWEI